MTVSALTSEGPCFIAALTMFRPHR